MKPSISSDVVEVPWRSFKAFVQLYDSNSLQRAPVLATLASEAGARTREPLLMHGLIRLCGDGQYVVQRGVPYGREGREAVKPVVKPHARSVGGIAWVYTQGRCAYCGTSLTFFSQLVLTQVDHHSPVMHCCRSCHATRGGRSLEEYRQHIEMQALEKRDGVRFTSSQLVYLDTLGVSLDIPKEVFWFERLQKSQATL
ncbi:MAG: hypothetical protein V3W04_13785 [Gammaproteobacteria bacterium]